MSERKPIKVDDYPEHVALMRTKKNQQFEADYESMVIDIPFTQHNAKLHVNASKNRYKNIVPCKSVYNSTICCILPCLGNPAPQR